MRKILTFNPRHSIISFVLNLQTLPYLISFSFEGEHIVVIGTTMISPMVGLTTNRGAHEVTEFLIERETVGIFDVIKADRKQFRCSTCALKEVSCHPGAHWHPKCLQVVDAAVQKKN